MSYIKRTLSYLKRNGIKATVSAVLERIDEKHMDPMQRRANTYQKPQEETASAAVGSLKPETDCTLKFSILVPAYETKPEYLRELIESVLSQSYPNFELLIADASDTEVVADAVKGYEDPRIVYLKLAANGGISENTNAALDMARGDYIGLLDHDDVLAPEALEEIYRILKQKPCDLVYTDEDKISADGTVWFEPNFKPDFNFDYLMCNNYICHFAVCGAELMKKLGFRGEFDGAQDYDFFLRLILEIEKRHSSAHAFSLPMLRERIAHVPKILYHWRAHEESTSDNPLSKLYAYEAGKRALESFLKEAGLPAEVSHSDHLGFYRLDYQPDFFTARKDVQAVCLLQADGRYVLHGPVLDGSEQFAGMNVHYSGYLHRAHMPFDADAATEGMELVPNPHFDATSCDRENAQGKLVYLPDRGWLGDKNTVGEKGEKGVKG